MYENFDYGIGIGIYVYNPYYIISPLFNPEGCTPFKIRLRNKDYVENEEYIIYIDVCITNRSQIKLSL